MPNKSNSPDNLPPQDSFDQDNTLSDDLDFWNLDNDDNLIEPSPEDLDEINKILAANKLASPLKSLSEKELVINLPDEKEIISSLESHEGSELKENISNLSNEDVQEILDSDNDDDESSSEKNSPVLPIPTKTRTPKSPTEKIATLACYILIIGVFAYLIHYSSKQHNFDTTKSYEANTPVDGANASIETIETCWSKPVGNNTKYGVILVPSATITLGSNSTSGVIRSVFYSSEEGLLDNLKPKGDPFTHQFRNGKFLSSGTNQVTVYGTDGFTEISNFMFYRSQDKERWTVEIKEAPSIQTEINSFKYLAQAPIEPLRK